MTDELVDPVIHITRVIFAAGVALALGLAITPKFVRWEMEEMITCIRNGAKVL